MSGIRIRPRRAIALAMTAAALMNFGCSFADPDRAVAAGHGMPPAALYDGLSTGEASKARKARQEALETLVRYRSSHWNSGRNGSKGETTPIRTYKSVGGHYCREFVEAVETPAAGRRVAVNTACRERNGQWKLVME